MQEVDPRGIKGSVKVFCGRGIPKKVQTSIRGRGGALASDSRTLEKPPIGGGVPAPHKHGREEFLGLRPRT